MKRPMTKVKEFENFLSDLNAYFISFQFMTKNDSILDFFKLFPIMLSSKTSDISGSKLSGGPNPFFLNVKFSYI